MNAQVLQPYTRPAGVLGRIGGTLGLIGLALFAFIYGFGYALTTPYLLAGFVVPLLLIGLVVIWALPDVKTAPTRTITSLLFAVVLFHATWPNYLAISLPSMPWITVLRIFFAPLLLAFLLALSSSATFRRDMSAVLDHSKLLVGVLLVFMVIQALTVPLSASWTASLQRTLVNYVYWFLVFFVAAYVLSREGSIRRFFWLLIGIPLLLLPIAVAEFRTQGVLWANHIPPFLKIDDPAVQHTLAGYGRDYVGLYRVTGTFSHPLLLAEYCAMVLPVAFFTAFRVREPALRVVCISSAAASVAIVFLTDARLGLISLLIGTAASIFLMALWTFRRDRGSILGIASLVAFPVAAALVAASTFFVGRIRGAVWGNSTVEHESTNARLQQMELGWPQFLRNPFGYGSGQSGNVVGWVAPGGKMSIDQGYLSMLIDYGAAGLLLFVAMLAIGIYMSVKHGVFSRSNDENAFLLMPVSVAILVFALTRAVLSVDYNMPLFFAMLGASAALIYRTKAAQALEQAAQRRSAGEAAGAAAFRRSAA